MKKEIISMIFSGISSCILNNCRTSNRSDYRSSRDKGPFKSNETILSDEWIAFGWFMSYGIRRKKTFTHRCISCYFTSKIQLHFEIVLWTERDKRNHMYFCFISLHILHYYTWISFSSSVFLFASFSDSRHFFRNFNS